MFGTIANYSFMYPLGFMVSIPGCHISGWQLEEFNDAFEVINFGKVLVVNALVFKGQTGISAKN